MFFIQPPDPGHPQGRVDRFSALMNEHIPLQGIRVVEIGDRIAVGACGSVLAALGADSRPNS